MNANELQHDWTERPRKRLTGTLSIRPAKPDEPANDDRGEPEPKA